MRYYTFLLALITIVLLGCENDNTSNANQDIIEELNDEKDNSTSQEVEAILASIPSHSEITATIKASGAPYSGLVVNNPVNAQSYSTNYRKAINLGIYGTDLGYMGVYDQSASIPEHLKIINQLASDIDLGHLLRTADINKMIEDGELTDSVFTVSAHVFEDMCKYLQTNERHETSVLMLLGGWLEAIHIATSVAYNSKIDNPNLNNKIAEQRAVLDKFIMAVEKYQNEQLFKQLLVDLTKLKRLFNEIEFSDSTANTATDTSVVQVPTSPAQITDVQLAQITIELTKIRKAVIKPM